MSRAHAARPSSNRATAAATKHSGHGQVTPWPGAGAGGAARGGVRSDMGALAPQVAGQVSPPPFRQTAVRQVAGVAELAAVDAGQRSEGWGGLLGPVPLGLA